MKRILIAAMLAFSAQQAPAVPIDTFDVRLVLDQLSRQYRNMRVYAKPCGYSVEDAIALKTRVIGRVMDFPALDFIKVGRDMDRMAEEAGAGRVDTCPDDYNHQRTLNLTEELLDDLEKTIKRTLKMHKQLYGD